MDVLMSDVPWLVTTMAMDQMWGGMGTRGLMSLRGCMTTAERTSITYIVTITIMEIKIQFKRNLPPKLTLIILRMRFGFYYLNKVCTF